MNWTEDQKTFVKHEWEAGVSARIIAAELHTSRNAICGLVNRNHWHTPTAYPKHPPRKNKSTRQVPYNIMKRNLNPVPQGPLERDPAPTVDDLNIPMEQRCTLMELRPNTCRWPIGDVLSPDFFFCGAIPMEDQSYCPAHFRRGTLPRRHEPQSQPHSYSLAKHAVRL